MLTLLWMLTGRARREAHVPGGFGPWLGIANREARRSLVPIQGAGIFLANWPAWTFQLLPQSETRAWLVDFDGPAEPPAGWIQTELFAERPIDEVLGAVAEQAAGRGSGAYPQGALPRVGILHSSPGETSTPTWEIPTISGKTPTKPWEIPTPKLALGTEDKAKLKGSEISDLLADIQSLVGRRAWDRFANDWTLAVTRWPRFFTRLISDCRAGLVTGRIRNPGAWMHHVAQQENKWKTNE